MEAWRAFLSAYRAVLDTLEHELRDETGLPLTWLDVLLHLARAPEGRLSMSQLAASVLLTPSGLTRLADRLEAEGLVERRRCGSDRRIWHVAVTDLGRQRLEAAMPVHLRGVAEHFAGSLTAEEADVMARALRRVEAACPPPAGRAAATG
jgi:DNA-binding MarR family transcriptional regulator